jgi:hypothetical protein
MRSHPFLPLLLLVPAISAPAQVSLSIGLPHLNIGINVPTVPQLVPVPDSPAYYAPGMNANYFFYDGMYWVFKDDNWYASSWYNGPWAAVHPEAVPLFVLRIPVGYYRRPPAYFQGWRREGPPRWDEHWGADWSRRRVGWNQWDRHAAPAPAPPPAYQRDYRRGQYPTPERQPVIHSENYHYQPQEPVVREHYANQAEHSRSAPPPGRPVERPMERPEEGPKHH